MKVSVEGGKGRKERSELNSDLEFTGGKVVLLFSSFPTVSIDIQESIIDVDSSSPRPESISAPPFDSSLDEG